MAALAVLVGSAEAVRPAASLDELAGLVDLAHISRAPARFDEDELTHLNARTVRALEHDAVRGRLAALGIAGGEAFWNAVRANLTTVSEAAEWWRIVEGPLAPVPADAGLLETAAGLLPPEPGNARRGGSGPNRSRRRPASRGVPCSARSVLRSPAARTDRSWPACCR